MHKRDLNRPGKITPELTQMLYSMYIANVQGAATTPLC